MNKDKQPLQFNSAEEVELFMRRHWIAYQDNVKSVEDLMLFTEYISNHLFLLKDTGWYWDPDNFIFKEIES